MKPPLITRLDWSSAIGLFIINFGMLDFLVFEFLESHLPPTQFSAVKRCSFHERADRVKAHVSQTDYSAAKKERFKNFFEHLDPMRDLRNHIAHSHLLIRLADDTKEPVLTLSLPMNLDAAYSPDSRHIDFAQLTKALDGLKELIEEFTQVTERIDSEYVDRAALY